MLYSLVLLAPQHLVQPHLGLSPRGGSRASHDDPAFHLPGDLVLLEVESRARVISRQYNREKDGFHQVETFFFLHFSFSITFWVSVRPSPHAMLSIGANNLNTEKWSCVSYERPVAGSR